MVLVQRLNMELVAVKRLWLLPVPSLDDGLSVPWLPRVGGMTAPYNCSLPWGISLTGVAPWSADGGDRSGKRPVAEMGRLSLARQRVSIL